MVELTYYGHSAFILEAEKWPIIESDPQEFVERLYKEYGQEGMHVKPGMKIIL